MANIIESSNAIKRVIPYNDYFEIQQEKDSDEINRIISYNVQQG